MSDIVTLILDQSTLWAPKIAGLLIVIAVFIILSSTNKKERKHVP